MWKPDINLKCPAGQQTRRCARTMAHRRRLLKGKVALSALGGLTVGLLLAGSINISNQTTALRTEIASLEARQEFLEAGNGHLLTRWNAATTTEVIVGRARKELGLVVPEDPNLVLVREEGSWHGSGSGLWQKFLSRFGGGTAAQAAEDPAGLVTGSMVSLTPRNGQGPRLADGDRP
jgi:cell division protein FtsB